jgi:hypothetical protein
MGDWLVKHLTQIKTLEQDDCSDDDIVSMTSSMNFFQRNILFQQVERNFCCYEVMKLMKCVVKTILYMFEKDTRTPYVIGPEMKRWITNLKVLSTSSAEGIALTGSIQFGDTNLVIKFPKYKNTDSIVHEYLVGQTLNDIREDGISNFMFVYGMFKCDTIYDASTKKLESLSSVCSTATPKNITNFLIAEHIPGDSLESLIPILSIKELLLVIIQLFLALERAKTKYGFAHNDLHCENVRLRRFSRPMTFSYPYKNTKVDISTKYLPVVIDYGMAVVDNYPPNNPDPTPEDIAKAPYKEVLFSKIAQPETDLYKFFCHLFTICAKLNPSLYNELKTVFDPYLSVQFSNPKNQRILSITTNHQDPYYYYPVLPDQFYTKTPSYSPVDIVDHIVSLPEWSHILDPPPIGGPSCLCTTSLVDLVSHVFSRSRNVCGFDSLYTRNQNFRDRRGRDRVSFECGKYFFDGQFNVVEFEQGLNMYFGSPKLALQNFEFQVGLVQDYYNKHITFSEEEIKFLQNAQETSERKLTMIHRKDIPSEIYVYASLQMARKMSNTEYIPSSGKPVKCGTKCVLSYRTTRSTCFVNLWEPYNIMVFLLSPDLSNESKFLLMLHCGAVFYDNKGQIPDLLQAQVYTPFIEKLKNKDPETLEIFHKGMRNFSGQFDDLADFIYPENPDPNHRISTSQDPIQQLQQAFHPQRRFVMSDLSEYDFPEILHVALMNICNLFGYDGYVRQKHPRTDGSGTSVDPAIFTSSQYTTFLERDYSDPNDWQYNDQMTAFNMIGKVIGEMSMYKTVRTDRHAGDLLQHSIWTALYAQYLIKTKSIFATTIQTFPDYFSIIIASAFLHDIGRTGRGEYREKQMALMFNDTDHSLHGAEMLKGSRPYYLASAHGSVEMINASAVLTDMNIPQDKQYIVIMCVLFHDLMEELLSNNELTSDQQAKMFVANIAKSFDRYQIKFKNEQELFLLFECIILVSIANIQATQPFVDHDEFYNALDEMKNKKSLFVYLNSVVEKFPYLTNMAQVYPGYKKFEEFKPFLVGFQTKVRDELRRGIEGKEFDKYFPAGLASSGLASSGLASSGLASLVSVPSVSNDWRRIIRSAQAPLV